MQIRRTPRHTVSAAIAVLALTAVAVVSAAPRPALSRVEFQPIDIVAPDPITPGQPLECDVTLTGGPANITIYSDPPGAVSYSGTMTDSSAAIEATTSADASGPVTIYCITDGTTVVATQDTVDPGYE